MRKGTLNFLSRKNKSLFDTNVKLREMDNVELVLDSSAIPESGTAKVRARPTVKHYTSSSDSMQGFAVPTPKVPLLPPSNGTMTNGSVGGDHLSNGSVIFVPDLEEGEILVPPPPSTAPPPPPTHFIPPPPDFMGDLSSEELAALQPPSMPPPKPPSLAPSFEEEDFSFLKPPPMAPPKPPSTCSSASTSSLPISTPDLDCPKCAPPQPPNDRHRNQKTPPPKPIRLSSIPNMDGPPKAPAPAPPVQPRTPSSFNPQNTAKLYNVPKSSILSGHTDRETARPRSILVLEDSGSSNSTPIPIQVNGKAPSVAPPSKPGHRNSSEVQLEKSQNELKVNVQVQTPLNRPKEEAKSETFSRQPEINKPVQTPPEVSPKLQKDHFAQVNLVGNHVKPKETPNQSHKFSPILDRKLHNLKGSETSGAREGQAASPLALLLAAKEREKQRSSLSRENSTKNNEQCSASIQPSDFSPNSSMVTPKATSSSSVATQGRQEKGQKLDKPLEPKPTIQTPGQHKSPALLRDKMACNPAVRGILTTTSQSISSLIPEKQREDRDSPPSICAPNEDDRTELCMPLLPPPPEFANSEDLDDIMELPPSFPPPDPPMKVPTPVVSPAPPVPGPPKPKAPVPPKLPPPDTNVKPKLPSPTKSKVCPTQLSAPLSATQATLLSILQKKMLEMDHKITPMREMEPSSDDWGSPLSDEETKAPAVSRATVQTKIPELPSKPATLDMHELESKIVKKYHEKSIMQGTSNGQQSKHQYGKTFTVRPGTKQPITLNNAS